jgi:chromosome partitioning protein
MKTIAVLNQKGGVGKTTTVANVSAALASFGAKVVAIDFDPQAHLTIHLGLEPQSLGSGSYKILTQSTPFESEIIMVRTNLWLLPANIHLVGAESELVSVVGRETILREAIKANTEQFDYCLIDCAPSLGLLTLNALAAAEEVLIPLQPHFLALQGFGKLLETIELVNRRINPDLTVKWILLCMFDSRASLPNEVKADIERFIENARGSNRAWAQAHVIPTFIRRNIKIAEAPSYGKTIFEYEPNCHGAEDYKKVAEFIHAQFQGPVTNEILQFSSTGDIPVKPDYTEPPAPEIQPPGHEEKTEESFSTTEQASQPDSHSEWQVPQPETPDEIQHRPDFSEPPSQETQQDESDYKSEELSVTYESVSQPEPDSDQQQTPPESPEEPAGDEQNQSKSPFEIRSIPQSEPKPPTEFTPSNKDMDQPEVEHGEY